MRLIFLIYFCELFPFDLRVDVKSDTIYVGTLVEIKVSVENNKKNEVPVFYELEENTEVFTVADKILTPISISYVLQFWKVGEIIIPSIPVDIKQNNHVISQIETNKITLNILSNISSTSNEMRSIKPMKDPKLTSPFEIALLLLSLVAGSVGVGYLWKTKTRPRKSKYLTGSFKISVLKKSVKEIEYLPLPEIIDSESTEKYYLKLSEICRLFFTEVFYIKATEMTSSELAEHFKLIGIDPELVNSWNEVCRIVDMAKYASHIPSINRFSEDKKESIKLITSFYKIQSQLGVNNEYRKFA